MTDEAGHDHQREQPGVAADAMQRLWTPWRYGYVAGGAPAPGCPFCVLPARGDDVSSLILHRGERAYVVLNAFPYSPGHLMAVPFEHGDDLAALDDDTADEVWSLGRRAVGILRETLGCGGVNLGMNLWAAGGAGIADHLHLHAVPRWSGDTNFMSVVGAARVLPQALDDVYAVLAPAFA